MLSVRNGADPAALHSQQFWLLLCAYSITLTLLTSTEQPRPFFVECEWMLKMRKPCPGHVWKGLFVSSGLWAALKRYLGRDVVGSLYLHFMRLISTSPRASPSVGAARGSSAGSTTTSVVPPGPAGPRGTGPRRGRGAVDAERFLFARNGSVDGTDLGLVC